MLERIGTPGHETISQPNAVAGQVIAELRRLGVAAPVVAEIGVGIGATSLAMARALDHRGELHLFDLERTLEALTFDLAAAGFANVYAHPNSDRHWDSYNWALGKLLLGGAGPTFDYVYLDGAHTFATDALAFFLCDRLLRPGGFLELDDYAWSFGASAWMAETRGQYMTAEQIATPQVAMVVDLCLRDNPDYEVVLADRLFRKRRALSP